MELKTPLLQRPMKELVAEVVKIKIPLAPILARAKRESETSKTTNLVVSLQRMTTRKTKKEPTPELSKEEEEVESKEEETVDSSSEEPESKEEAELASPPPEKKKKMKTRASNWKKPISAFKIPVPQ